jgi:hypothetical protein
MQWINWGGGPFLLVRRNVTLATVYKQGPRLFCVSLTVVGKYVHEAFYDLDEAKRFCETKIRGILKDTLAELGDGPVPDRDP